MIRRIAILAIVIYSCTDSNSGAAQRKSHPAPAPGLTRQIEKRYQALKSISYNIEGKMTFKGPGGELATTVMRTEVRYARMNRFVISTSVEHIGQDFHSTLTSDGQRIWEWNPDDRRYTEKPVSSIPKTPDGFGTWIMERGAGDLNLLLFLGGAHPISAPPGPGIPYTAPRITTATLDEGRRAYRMDFSGLAAGGGKTTASLFFDAKDLLLRRSKVVVPTPRKKTGGVPVDMIVEFDYKDIVTDEPVEDDTFKFHPPDNGTLAAQMKSVLARATAIDTSEVKIPERFQNKPEKPDPNAPPP